MGKIIIDKRVFNGRIDALMSYKAISCQWNVNRTMST